MLNLVLGDPQYGQYDFGNTINVKIYQQDKSSLFDLTGLTGVIQTFKRYGDDNFLPFKDVARAIRLTGNMAQVIDDIPLVIATPQSSAVLSYIVTNQGSGYSASPTVTVTGGGGSDATVIVTVIGGEITSILVDVAGSGYTTPPTVTITDPTGVNAAATAVITSPLFTGEATFEWTKTDRPSLFGRFWIKALAINGASKQDDPRESTRFVSVYVHPGAPQ